MQYRQVRILCGKGSAPDQFVEALNGICVDAAGLVYAVGDREVKVLDANGKLQRRWETNRPGYCVAVDGAGNVYVGEAEQIERFDSLGRRLETWQDADRLGVVTSIAFFGEHVFAGDARARCIRRLDKSGRWQSDIGKDNNTKGFMIPNGVLDLAVDAAGVIHVANSAKHRVERYALTGELLGHFGRFGSRKPADFPGCCNPTNLALTQDGEIVVTEKAAPRMKRYDATGKLLAIVGPEAFDANCKNMDVAVDAKGHVYVVDTVKLSILVFAPEQDEHESPQ